jgi:hypothetical protein
LITNQPSNSIDKERPARSESMNCCQRRSQHGFNVSIPSRARSKSCWISSIGSEAKRRESLDKQDKRDIAQSIIARDRNGRLVPFIREIRALEFQPEADAEAGAANQENLAPLRMNALEDLIADEENGVVEADWITLRACLEMAQTEFALLETLVRVYDHARSNFVSEICESVKRFLHAIRIRFEENARRLNAPPDLQEHFVRQDAE